MEPLTPRALDIGGGKGEYFKSLAVADTKTEYIVLDPFAIPPIDNPSNLQFLDWSAVVDRVLPFDDSSVAYVHIAFLMGVVRDAEGRVNDKTFDDVLAMFLPIVRESSRVLTSNGTLEIVDARQNTQLLVPKLPELGLSIHGYGLMPDMHRTPHIEMFWKAFEKGGRPFNESYSVPMQLLLKHSSG